jgi:Type IV secretion system pilin
MKSIIRKSVAATLGMGGFLLALPVLAQNVPSLVNPLNTTDATVVLGYFNTFLIAIAAPICGIMVVWGGFQMMTSAGNPEKFSEGRRTLLYAAIGFVVVIFASSISYVLKSIINGS